MRVTQEQLDKDLKQPLIDLGYKVRDVEFINDWILTNNFNGENSKVDSIVFDDKYNKDRYYIDHYNPALFLALAAMTDEPNGIDGEWFVYNGLYYQKGFVRPTTSIKATKQQLISEFTEIKIESESDERREYFCINFLKGRGFKITKTETITKEY